MESFFSDTSEPATDFQEARLFLVLLVVCYVQKQQPVEAGFFLCLCIFFFL